MFDLESWINTSINFFHSPTGVLCFISLYAIWVTLLLPGGWATLLSGFIYGPLYGTIFVLIGAVIGAEVSFLLARGLLRVFALKLISNSPKLIAIETAVNKEGLRLVFLSRLSPAFPFSLLNFLYGLSDISLRDFTIGLLGIVPGTILFCNLGALAGEISHLNEILSGNKDPISLLFSLIGILATILCIWLVTKRARDFLNETGL